MTLKSIVEKLDGIPEALQGEYVKTTIKVNGKDEERFVLQLEDDVKEHPKVVSLKNAHERQKTDNQTLKTQNEQFKTRLEGLPEDFDAHQFNELKERAEGKGEGKFTQEQVDRRLQQEATKWEQKLNAEKSGKETVTKALHRRTIDDGLTAALVKAGVDPKLLDATKALLKERGKFDLDDKFEAKVETDMGPRTVTEFVNDWAASDEGKTFVKKPTGSDANGGGSGNVIEGNPFNRKDGAKPNYTEIDQLVSQDKSKAKSLAKQAGWSDNELSRIGIT